ncbi:MAG: glycosyltransferase family 2 protein [Sphingobacteriales bacterium]|nr:glycosyltransferase family 2 protein [Sphingobacteriales bacterium]
MLVSVVLTSYNHLPLLQRAFASLLAQTYSPLEIIIVDDGSTDGSCEWIAATAEQYPQQVRYFFQPQNVGIPRNKNTGFKMAKGEWITYLDGDDWYYPEKISSEIAALRQHPDCEVVYSNFEFRNEITNTTRRWLSDTDTPKTGLLLKEIITRDFPHNTIFRFELMHRSVLERINYYDERIAAFHDWDSRIRYAAFARIAYAPYIGSSYEHNTQGISKRLKRIKLLQEMQWVFEKNIDLCKQVYAKEETKKIQNTMQHYFSFKYPSAVKQHSRWRAAWYGFKHLLRYPKDIGAINKMF